MAIEKTQKKIYNKKNYLRYVKLDITLLFTLNAIYDYFASIISSFWLLLPTNISSLKTILFKAAN